MEKKLRNPKPSSQREEKAKNKKDNMFQKDTSFLKDPRKITPILSISSVESPYWKEEKTEGLVYLYYYPKGRGRRLLFTSKGKQRRGVDALFFRL